VARRVVRGALDAAAEAAYGLDNEIDFDVQLFSDEEGEQE
jgi:hypothetical protein